MRAALNPYLLVSICTITGLDLLSYVRVVLKRVWQIQALRCWELYLSRGDNPIWLAFCERTLLMEMPGMKGCR